MKNHTLLSQVHHKTKLKKAWSLVYSNGRNSTSTTTQEDVTAYNIGVDKKISEIKKSIKGGTFKFGLAKGIPIKKKNKETFRPRPLVISELPDRIVQRSLLDVLQDQTKLKRYMKVVKIIDGKEVSVSFGGLKKESVNKAITEVCMSIGRGSRYFIRTDIPDFFPNIPRDEVLRTITGLLKDDTIKDLLEDATDVELKNLSELRRGGYHSFFPHDYVGVAQGSCLSPLFGNILLHRFDKDVNAYRSKVDCFRFIDDFIILGPTEESVKKTFAKAKSILKKMNLRVYHPDQNPDKASSGKVSEGIDFLGCHISESIIQPNKASKKSILQKVRDLFTRNTKTMQAYDGKNWSSDASLLQSLHKAHNTIRGWGNQYSFCNATYFFEDIDKQLDKYIGRFIYEYSNIRDAKMKEGISGASRHLLGVHKIAGSDKETDLGTKIYPLKLYPLKQ